MADAQPKAPPAELGVSSVVPSAARAIQQRHQLSHSAGQAASASSFSSMTAIASSSPAYPSSLGIAPGPGPPPEGGGRHYFGADLSELAAASGHLLPRLLVFLGDSILDRCAADSSITAATVRGWIAHNPDPEEVADVRAALDAGETREGIPPATLFYLLKCFVRELPVPMVPQQFYAEALDIVTEQLRRCAQCVGEREQGCFRVLRMCLICAWFVLVLRFLCAPAGWCLVCAWFALSLCLFCACYVLSLLVRLGMLVLCLFCA